MACIIGTIHVHEATLLLGTDMSAKLYSTIVKCTHSVCIALRQDLIYVTCDNSKVILYAMVLVQTMLELGQRLSLSYLKHEINHY